MARIQGAPSPSTCPRSRGGGCASCVTTSATSRTSTRSFPCRLPSSPSNCPSKCGRAATTSRRCHSRSCGRSKPRPDAGSPHSPLTRSPDMFTRDTSRQARIDTLIGKAARVHGDVDFQGGLHLDGHILGNVRSDEGRESTLSVSETGSIEGAVQVPNVMLNGAVKGDIYARERVVLGATARVEGNVYYGIIEMTLGAQIIGKLVRLEPETPPAAGSAA